MTRFQVIGTELVHREGYMFPQNNGKKILGSFTYRKDATKFMKTYRLKHKRPNISVIDIHIIEIPL